MIMGYRQYQSNQEAVLAPSLPDTFIFREGLKISKTINNTYYLLTLLLMERADSTSLPIVFCITSVRDAAEPQNSVT